MMVNAILPDPFIMPACLHWEQNMGADQKLPEGLGYRKNYVALP